MYTGISETKESQNRSFISYGLIVSTATRHLEETKGFQASGVPNMVAETRVVHCPANSICC